MPPAGKPYQTLSKTHKDPTIIAYEAVRSRLAPWKTLNQKGRGFAKVRDPADLANTPATARSSRAARRVP